MGLVSGPSSSCHEGFQAQQKMGKAQQCKLDSDEVTGWVGKQTSNILHKALTMGNVFLIICSLLETCRFQSLRHTLAATGVILAVIVQLAFLVFWIHYRPFKDGVCSNNTLPTESMVVYEVFCFNKQQKISEWYDILMKTFPDSSICPPSLLPCSSKDWQRTS